jgi:DNA-binding NarL/FixJ family response regulator
VIRVLLVDDHASFREALGFMIAREPDMRVVDQAGTFAEGVEKAREIRRHDGTDVAIVDVALPDGDGIEIVAALRDAEPAGRAPRVIVLTAFEDRIHLARAVEAGASAVLNKAQPIAQIVAAIRQVEAGEELVPPREMVQLLTIAGRHRAADEAARAKLESLTPREAEVLAALADGLSDQEIAERLSIGYETVRTHMVRLMRKLDVDSRLQAALFAVRHGLVRPENGE